MSNFNTPCSILSLMFSSMFSKYCKNVTGAENILLSFWWYCLKNLENLRKCFAFRTENWQRKDAEQEVRSLSTIALSRFSIEKLDQPGSQR